MPATGQERTSREKQSQKIFHHRGTEDTEKNNYKFVKT